MKIVMLVALVAFNTFAFSAQVGEGWERFELLGSRNCFEVRKFVDAPGKYPGYFSYPEKFFRQFVIIEHGENGFLPRKYWGSVSDHLSKRSVGTFAFLGSSSALTRLARFGQSELITNVSTPTRKQMFLNRIYSESASTVGKGRSIYGILRSLYGWIKYASKQKNAAEVIGSAGDLMFTIVLSRALEPRVRNLFESQMRLMRKLEQTTLKGDRSIWVDFIYPDEASAVETPLYKLISFSTYVTKNIGQLKKVDDWYQLTKIDAAKVDPNSFKVRVGSELVRSGTSYDSVSRKISFSHALKKAGRAGVPVAISYCYRGGVRRLPMKRSVDRN